ncbi:MAG: phosphoglucosamine mutase [Candidatus Aenigmarchaeota archaeon]|nr:phosphoglucosamine mutase [Candidatus Aenigmarchaeota archaeon]
MMDEHIFRAYDIRGIFGKDLTTEIAENIGKAFGTYIGSGKEIIVGRDARLSGEVLKAALIKGLISVGCNVIDVGIVTTPVVYFSIEYLKKDGGVMITASHNPPEWNGFKLCGKNGISISESLGLEKVKEIFIEQKFDTTKKGSISHREIVDEYIKFVVGKVKLKKKLKVVLDTGNGVCALTAPSILERLGCDVVTINKELDGRFPNRSPDPTEAALEALRSVVLEEKADVGIAFDGDGDRVAFVDEKGRYISSGNVTIPIFASSILKANKNSKIVFDVCCSNAVEEIIKAHNGIPLVNRVGRAYIRNRMLEEGAIFGGEHSNHLFFSDIFSFDDGVFAGVKMVELLSNSDKPISSFVDAIPIYPSISVKEIVCPDNFKFNIMKNLKKRFSGLGHKIIDLDGIKIINSDGWVLIRPSNTLPAIKINSEAKTMDKAKELFSFAENIVREEIAEYV